MVKPIDSFADVTPGPLLEALRKPLGYETPLPIQRVVVPQVMAALVSSIHFDICLSAPTGAGKTLCYLLPAMRHIAALKAKYNDTQFRAVVLVPTKALGHQVAAIARAMAKPLGIDVALCCGDDRDAARLVQSVTFTDGTTRSYATADVLIATPQKLTAQLLLPRGIGGARKPAQPSAEAGGMVPGGDDVDGVADDDDGAGTYESLLSFVEMLVIDEADELLCGGFSAFACRVASSIEAMVNASGTGRPLHKMLCSATLTSRIANISELHLRNAKAYALDADGVHDEAAAAGAEGGMQVADGGARVRSRLALPAGLTEHLVIVRQEAQRHAVLLRVIRHILDTISGRPITASAAGESGNRRPRDSDSDVEDEPAAASSAASPQKKEKSTSASKRGYRTILVFAASTEQARVLSHFLLHAGHRTLEFTTAASEPERRRAVLEAYAGSDTVVVATDALMRGIDLPGVTAVVMYDAPRALQQYVHRIGRTARAGKTGHSFALLSREGVSGDRSDGEVAVFKSFEPFLKRGTPVVQDVALREVDELLPEADKCLERAREGLERRWASAAALYRHVAATTSGGGPPAAQTTSSKKERQSSK